MGRARNFYFSRNPISRVRKKRMSATGLSNQAQSLLVLLSMIFVSIGVLVTAVPSEIPQPLNAYIGFGLMVIGAIGLAIKEWLGIVTPTPATNAPPPAKQATQLANFPPAAYHVRRRLMFLAYLK